MDIITLKTTDFEFIKLAIQSIGFLATATAVYVAYRTLRANHEWNRRHFAAQLMEKWNPWQPYSDLVEHWQPKKSVTISKVA